MAVDLSRYRDLFASEATRHLDLAEAHLASPESARREIQSVFRAFHTVKGMSATMNVPAMVLVAHALEEACSRAVASGVPVNDEFVLLLSEGTDRLRAQLSAFLAGREPLLEGGFEDRVREFIRAGGTFAFTLLRPPDEVVAAPMELKASRLEGAQGCIAEALSALGRLRSLPGIEVAEVNRAEDAIRRLYEQVVVLRGVAFGSVVPALRRHVRDVAARQGKAATLRTLGEEVEVDADVLSRLYAARVALVNNAVVHGVEDAQARRGAGKSRVASVLLAAERVGRHLVLRVEDDGRGFDVASLARGGEDPLREAFREGVSTAKLSHDAGRGVGLGVVRELVASVGGSLVLSSTPGVGTRVRIEAPVLADLVSVWVVRRGDEVLGLRSAVVSRREGTTLHMVDGRELAFDEVRELGDFIVSAPPFPLQWLKNVRGTTVASDGRILLVVDL